MKERQRRDRTASLPGSRRHRGRPTNTGAEFGGLSNAEQASQEQVAKLFDAHGPEIRSFVARRVGDSEAEDILSEIFFEAARHLRQQPDRPLGIGWLVTVARRRVIDYWRARSRQRHLHDQLAAEVWRSQLVAASGASDSGSAGDGVANRSAVYADFDAFAELPERQQQAVILRYSYGFSVGEVARLLGCSYRAAESLLARSRRRLAQGLAGVN